MEPFLLNPTALSADVIPFGDPVASWTVVAKGTYDLSDVPEIRPAEEPEPLAEADIPYDPPADKLIKYEADYIPFKPKADVLCVGNAHAPGGSPKTEFEVSFSVGERRKVIRVVGNRKWEGRIKVGQSRPKPFVSMPVSYLYAYGGTDTRDPDSLDSFAHNPLGKGYVAKGKGLAGSPLPNIESPRHPIKSWKDRVAPIGFGPIGRTWLPRLALAGTFDEEWLENRAPELPVDLDESFYNCAPINQQIEGYLRGDETIRVENMHPDLSMLEFRLPGRRVRALLDGGEGRPERLIEIPMNLDTLWLDTEEQILVLVWRGRIADDATLEDPPLLLVEEELETARPAKVYQHQIEVHLQDVGGTEVEAEEAQREIARSEAVGDETAETIPGGGDSSGAE